MPLLQLARLLLSAATLASPSANVSPAPVGKAYPAVTVGWAAALARDLPTAAGAESGRSAAVLGGLALVEAKDLSGRQAMAPVIDALAHDLELTPEGFRALPPRERASALAAAAEQAQDNVAARVRALANQAARLPERHEAGDPESRRALYYLVSELEDLRAYSGYLEDQELKLLERSASLATARAFAVRAALLRQAGEETAEALAGPPGVPAAAVPEPARANANARKLLENMRVSRTGWSLDDLRVVFTGHGFEERGGGKHVLFIHPRHPNLMKAVSRTSGTLAKGYTTAALSLIRRARELDAAKPGDAPAPAASTLADFAILLARPASSPRAPKPRVAPPAPAAAAKLLAPRVEAPAPATVRSPEPASPAESPAAVEPSSAPEPESTAAPAPAKPASIYDVIFGFILDKISSALRPGKPAPSPAPEVSPGTSARAARRFAKKNRT